MGKQLHSALVASAALIILAIPLSWAARGGDPGLNCEAPGQANKPPCNQVNQAPEINVGTGGAGLTVIAIALLLASERRSRAS